MADAGYVLSAPPYHHENKSMVASHREQNSDTALRCYGKQANHELAYAYEVCRWRYCIRDYPKKLSMLDVVVREIHDCSNEHKMKLNPKKCKEM